MSDPFDGMAEAAIQSFFEDPYEGAYDNVLPETITERAAPTSTGELFGRGFEAGVSGMRASADYFAALGNTLVGDEEGKQNALLRAERHDKEAADALSGLQTFEGFLEAPNFESGLDQAILAAGQGIPSVGSTIIGGLATGGTALLTNILGRGAIDLGRKVAINKTIKDSAEKVAKGTATPDEKEFIDRIYGGLKELSFKRGAVAGGFTAGYVPLAGQNLSEGIESGRDVDTDLALRSLLVATPQAALEVAAPAVLFNSFAKVARSKAAEGDSILGSIFEETVRGAGRGFLAEGATEAGQETISVLNRMDMDPTFTREEGMLRVGQAAFMGGVTGKVVGGAGGLTSGTAKAANSIFQQASQRLEAAQEQRAEEALDEESGVSPQEESPQDDFVGPRPRQEDLFDPYNAPEKFGVYEPTLQERIEIDYAKRALEKQRREDEALQKRAKTDKRRKQAKKNFTPKDEDGLLAAIAARGGLDRADYDIASGDYKDYYKTRVGSKFVFTKKGGLSAEDMFTRLQEDNWYITKDALGDVSADKEPHSMSTLLDDLDNALRSDKPYFTATKDRPEQDMDAMYEDYMDTYFGDRTDQELEDERIAEDEEWRRQRLDIQPTSEEMARDYYENYYTEEERAADQALEDERLAEDAERRRQDLDSYADPLTEDVIAEAGSGYNLDINRVAVEGDGLESPWLTASGKVIGTGQDHIAFASDAMGVLVKRGEADASVWDDDFSYSDFMRATRSIRFGAFRDFSNGYVVSVHVAEGQKLTPAQIETLRYLNEQNGGNVKMLYGEADGMVNPEYLETTVSEFLERYKPDVIRRDMETFTPTDAEGEFQRQLPLEKYGTQPQPTVSGEPATVSRSQPKTESGRTNPPTVRSYQPRSYQRKDASARGQQKQAQFREKMATAFENLAANNPDDQRIQDIATRYITGNSAVRDGILQTMFAPHRDEQYIDPNTTDGAANEEIKAFFEGEGFQEATEEVAVSENTVKKDPEKVFPNTEESRQAFIEAFGEVDFNDPTYAYMTEAFLRQAAAAKKESDNVKIEVDRDLLGKPERYRLTKTEFKRDEQAPNKEFVEEELKLAVGSTFADGSGAELVFPDGTVQPVNLVNLTNSGRRLLQMRGDETFQGNAQITMAQKGLPEFLSELKQVDEGYDVRVNGVSLYGLDNKQSVRSQIGREKGSKLSVTGARAYGSDIPVEEVLQPDQERVPVRDRFGNQKMDGDGNPLFVEKGTNLRHFVLVYPNPDAGELKTEYLRYGSMREARQKAASLKADGADAEAFSQSSPMYSVSGTIRTKPPVESPTRVVVGYRGGVAAVKQAEANNEGVSVLRKAGEQHYGNPFSHLNNARDARKTKNLQDSVDQYNAWLRGTDHTDFKQDRRDWVIGQIDSGALDNQTLLYYSRQKPNHAEALAAFVKERRASSPVPDINVFHGNNQNADLSNLASRPFTYQGREYLTVEHAYQTLKGGSFDQKTYDAYNRLPNAEGKKITGPRADTKDNANIRLMETLMRESFQQNKEAAQSLRETGSARITHNQDKGVWKEEFPRILMAIRAELREKTGRIIKGKLTPSRLRQMPKTLVVFGDNLLETGKGGQAIIRDEPNAFGVPTKRAPKRTDDAYFSDKPDEIEAVLDALETLRGRDFVLPEAGIGTGLAQLQQRSPQIANILDSFFGRTVEGYTPKERIVGSPPIIPVSGIAGSPEESIGRRQQVDAMNEASRQSEIDRRKQIYSFEREFTQIFFDAEKADAYAARARDAGADNVVVQEVGATDPDISPDDPSELAIGSEDGLQQGDYNLDPDTGKRLHDGVPMSRLNLESNPRFEMDRRAAVPNRPARPQISVNPKVAAATAVYPTGKLSSTIEEVVSKTMRVVRPNIPVAVMGVREILQKSDAELRTIFDNPVVIRDIKQQAQRMQSSTTGFGHYMGFRNAHMILVDNTKGNELQQALVTAHELGHVLFQTEKDGILANPMLRQRMWDAFIKARKAKDAPEQYRGEENLAFEEWFSDQVAVWARTSKTKSPRGVVQSTFKKIADKLERLWKAIRGELRRRFSANDFTQDFNNFMDNTVQAHRRNAERVGTAPVSATPFFAKKLVRDMEAATTDANREAADKVIRGYKKVLYGDKSREATKFILAEDNMLRAISPKIADMFYIPAQSAGKGSALGFINAKTDKRNEMLNDLEDILGDKWDTPEIENVLLEASSDTPTEELSGKAREIRDWLTNLHENYISKTPDNQIAFRENYFPVALDLAGIYENPEAFIQVVLKYNTEQSEAQIRQIVDGLVAQRAHILEDGEIDFDATNPVKVVEEARVLTDKVPSQELRKFIESPDVALIRYIRHQAIRNEFLRNTRAMDGTDLLTAELNKLRPKDRAKAVQIIERYLGYTKTPLNPTLQKVNSYLQLFNWVTLLPLATISSITEMGGAIVNTKDFNGFEMALKSISANIKNRDQAINLARQLGVTVSTAMGNLGLTDADDEFLDPRVRKLSDKFFKVIGLDWYTRFTREFASGVGVEFIKEHANPKTKNKNSERFLDQLGLNAEAVQAWEKNQVEGEHYNFEGPEGQAVKAGLRRFVENSMLRPNAAERTFWGNDPRFSLIWSLKSFLFSFGKVIIGGIGREMAIRYREADTRFERISSIGMVGVLAAAAFMPLAMLSLELRELAKAGLAGVLPFVEPDARYFRSDRMDYGTYLAEIFARSGFQGPMSILFTAMSADKYGGTGVGAIFGPTAGFIVDDVAMGLARGEGWEIVPSRILPGYSVIR